MKIRYFTPLLFCCLFTACDRGNSTANASAEARKRYAVQVQQEKTQQEDYAQRAKRAGELLQEQEKLHQRNEAMITTGEQMLQRQQEDLARFEKILDTWERQQQQYQKYLDSLQTGTVPGKSSSPP